MERLELSRVVSEAGYCAGNYGNVVVVEWRDRPTKAAVDRVSVIVEELLAAQDGPIAFLVIARGNGAAPDTDARDGFAKTMKSHADRIAGAVLVIEGTGLRSAAVRAVATAISLLGGGWGWQACATADEGVEHAARLLQKAGDPTMLPSMLSLAVSRLRQTPPEPAAG